MDLDSSSEDEEILPANESPHFLATVPANVGDDVVAVVGVAAAAPTPAEEDKENNITRALTRALILN